MTHKLTQQAWIFALWLGLMIGTGFAQPAEARDFRVVSDRSEFVQLVSGKRLTMRIYNLALSLSPDGGIRGDALGWQVTGSWSWQNGAFCRQMNWSGTPIPYTCQQVEVAGNQMRFTTNDGSGDSATFGLR